ncbi:MAG: DNRLRE domain-containing protein, partial [Micromonosporaceae bacterium]|nr:DNRLRE domain-containing protein [Micromonosporaceae bacterium]
MRARQALAAALATTIVTTLAVIVPASPAQAATRTFTPTADAFTQRDTPTTNYGQSSQLVADAYPTRRVFATFTISGLTERVTAARLRLHASSSNSGAATGGTIKTVSSTTWSETGLTWNKQPAMDGPTLAILGSVRASTWYEITVTGAVTGNGTIRPCMSITLNWWSTATCTTTSASPRRTPMARPIRL